MVSQVILAGEVILAGGAATHGGTGKEGPCNSQAYQDDHVCINEHAEGGL